MESPFVPGARVAIAETYGDGYREGFVEKVYKSGNFTLRGSKQQWRPWSPSSYSPAWTAVQTGNSYRRDHLKLWDAGTDDEISQAIAKTKRRDRLRILRQSFDGIKAHEVTDAILDQIEAALAAAKGGA